MRILFDQGTPAPLREHLPGHSVETAYEKGWPALRNGELLAKAEAEFDVLVTTDRNLRHQQNLADRRIAILDCLAHLTPPQVLSTFKSVHGTRDTSI